MRHPLTLSYYKYMHQQVVSYSDEYTEQWYEGVEEVMKE